MKTAGPHDQVGCPCDSSSWHITSNLLFLDVVVVPLDLSTTISGVFPTSARRLSAPNSASFLQASAQITDCGASTRPFSRSP